MIWQPLAMALPHFPFGADCQTCPLQHNPSKTVPEDQPQYTVGIDPDSDSDPDTRWNREQNGSLTTGGWHWQLVACVAQQQEAFPKSANQGGALN
jgi:hypothetical protein